MAADLRAGVLNHNHHSQYLSDTAAPSVVQSDRIPATNVIGSNMPHDSKRQNQPSITSDLSTSSTSTRVLEKAPAAAVRMLLKPAVASSYSPPQRASDKFLAMAKSIGSSSFNEHHPSPETSTLKQAHQKEQGSEQPTKATRGDDHRGRKFYATHFAFTPSQVHQKKSEARFVADFMSNRMINEGTALVTGAIDAAAAAGGVPGVDCSDLWELNDSKSPFKRSAGFPEESEVQRDKNSRARSSPTRRFLSVTEMAQTLVQREGPDDCRHAGAKASPKLNKSGAPTQTAALTHLSIDFLRKHAATHPALAAQLLAREKQQEKTLRDNARRAAAAAKKHRKARTAGSRKGPDSDNQIARTTPTVVVAKRQTSKNASSVLQGREGSDARSIAESYEPGALTNSQSAKVSPTEKISTSVVTATEQQARLRVLVLTDSCQSIEIEIDRRKTARHFYSCLYRRNAQFFQHDRGEAPATDPSTRRQCPPPKSVLYSGLGNTGGTSGLIHRDKTTLEDQLLSDTSVLQFVHYFASVQDAVEDLEVKAARQHDPHKDFNQPGSTSSEKWFATGMLFGAKSFGTSPAAVMQSSISLVGTLLRCVNEGRFLSV